ncbi:conserved hypothetical protein [Sporisorium reilianum SRZ2]|uniref:Spt20-like SEP domain-containing protein n=1 Tax=Sporisorium reilianum (strain SRZ2) TaxID=999809 RepID=E6ZN01_SPORE|nr:conserved hypothetical protein [Sporisorium reilianum SRZ2]
MATTASVYNTSRTTRQILRRHRKDKPSLILHLHNHHFRFERQNGMFLFDSPVKAFLGYIRDQKVPADLIDVLTESGVQFFEGCLLVDVHDHRSHAAASASILGPRELHGLSAAGSVARAGRDGAPGIQAEGGLASSLFYLQEGGRYGARKLLGATGSTDPRTGGLGGVEIYRIVLHPTSETLWADIKMLDDMAGAMWSDQEALEVEAKILALTAPPLCLTPDPQATRIANLMLSSTALPSAYNPSHDSPYRSAKKRGANSIEMEKEEANRQRRDKIMRLMQHGHRSAVPPQAMQSVLARPGPAMGESGASASAAAATAFVPTFDRMTFIERWRIGRNAALNGGLPGAPPPGATAKAGKEATKPNDKDDTADAANTSPAKKLPSKKTKKAQREKEEAEAAAAAAEAAKKKAEEEAAAAAAAAKKPKKKLTKKEREEKERKNKEEKEKAEKEEKERKDKEAAAAAAANGKPAKPKSKKKQKEEAAAAAAAAAAAESAETAKTPAKNAKADAPGSPEKDKKASPKKTSAKKPATAAAATPATAAATPASTGKKKTPAKSDKKNAAATTTTTNGNTDYTPSAAVQGTPILGSATPSVQSTPTPAHRSIPSQPQQQQQLQQQMQPFTQQQLQQAALAGMFPNMANQLPFGTTPNAASGFGMPMMNGFAPTSNAQATAAALAAMQGMGLGQFGGGGVNFNNAAQMQQMMSMMNAGGMVGFNGMPGFGGQPGGGGQQVQQQQGQPGAPQQQGQQGQGGGDMPVGVGLAGLANWGTGK